MIQSLQKELYKLNFTNTMSSQPLYQPGEDLESQVELNAVKIGKLEKKMSEHNEKIKTLNINTSAEHFRNRTERIHIDGRLIEHKNKIKTIQKKQERILKRLEEVERQLGIKAESTDEEETEESTEE